MLSIRRCYKENREKKKTCKFKKIFTTSILVNGSKCPVTTPEKKRKKIIFHLGFALADSKPHESFAKKRYAVTRERET